MAQWRKSISNDPKWMVTYSNGQILWIHSNPNSEPKSFGNSVKLNCEGLARKWVRWRIEGSSTRNQQNPKASGLWFLTHTQQGFFVICSVPRRFSRLAMGSRTGMIWWSLEVLNGNGLEKWSPHITRITIFILKKQDCWVNLHHIPTIQDGVANFDLFQKVMQSVKENAEEMGAKFDWNIWMEIESPVKQWSLAAKRGSPRISGGAWWCTGWDVWES